MAVQSIDIEAFLALARCAPVLDVRSPGEYAHAHIPGALSFPLFSDEERKEVGTTYKQQSREAAIKIGLDYFGLKMRKMVEAAESLAQQYAATHAAAEKNTLLVHCWRGGMRSAGVAWLLDLYGFKVYTLMGGYKSFRHWVLAQFEKSYPFILIGGYTGSGKTHLLAALQQRGQTIIDIEGLAQHKGSAFGNLGMPPQPTQEMFENQLAFALYHAMEKISAANTIEKKFIWLEDESQRVGDLNIPLPLWKQMQAAPLVLLDIPFEARLKHILAEYGDKDKERMINAIMRIKKRLGGLEAKNAINALLEDDTEACFRILLRYYDKQYQRALEKRATPPPAVRTFAFAKPDPRNALHLLQLQS